LFIVAGLFEIGGGYLVWQWWRSHASFIVGAFGALVLFLYEIVPTYQTENFGRVYEVYGVWLSCFLSCGAGRWTKLRLIVSILLAATIPDLMAVSVLKNSIVLAVDAAASQ
jgi:hypothetical protein